MLWLIKNKENVCWVSIGYIFHFSFAAFLKLNLLNFLWCSVL